MQCIGCQFQNMPGVAVCGRCGSPLDLKQLSIDVQPPRASQGAKLMRRVFRTGAVSAQLRDASANVRQALRSQLEIDPRTRTPDWAVLIRFVIPGWAHAYLGDNVRGWLFFGSFVFLAALAILFMGTFPGWMLLGLAFSVHLTACVSVLRLGGFSPSALYQIMPVTAGVLILLLYLPAGWAVSNIVYPMQINLDRSPFQAGDVVLTHPWAIPRSGPSAGTLVLYEQRATQPFQVRGGTEHVNYMIQGGPVIDRVLGGPGDEVEWDGRRLRVNGRESPYQPLNPQRCPVAVKLTVPQHSVFILPSTAGLPAPMPDAIWRQVSVVSIDAVQARVSLRTQPFSRFGRIR